MSEENINYICVYLDSAKTTPLCIKPCILVGFYAFLRGSNLVATNGTWEGPHTLIARNLLVTSKGLIIVICSTKSRRKPYAITLPRNQNQMFCPVHAWEVYVSNVKPVPSGPAFILNDRSPLTSKVVVAFMRAALSNDIHFVHDPSCITMHSLRRGAVKDAQDSGFQVDEIMSLGAWASKSGIKPYLYN